MSIIRDAVQDQLLPFVLVVRFVSEEAGDEFEKAALGQNLILRRMRSATILVTIVSRTDRNKAKALDTTGIEKVSTRGVRLSHFLLERVPMAPGYYEAMDVSAEPCSYPGMLMTSQLDVDHAALVFFRWQFEGEPTSTLEGSVRYCRRGYDDWNDARLPMLVLGVGDLVEINQELSGTWIRYRLVMF